MIGPEAKITQQIRDWLKTLEPEVWCFKVHGGPMQQAGIPDIVGCQLREGVDAYEDPMNQGWFFALEIKAPGNKPTALQLAMLERIRKAGGIGAVVYSLEEAKKALGYA